MCIRVSNRIPGGKGQKHAGLCMCTCLCWFIPRGRRVSRGRDLSCVCVDQSVGIYVVVVIPLRLAFLSASSKAKVIRKD